MTISTAAADGLRLPVRIRSYLDAVVQACAAVRPPLVSLIVFGSSTRGGFSPESDVDLIVVVEDGMTAEDRIRLQQQITRLETSFGFRPATDGPTPAWQARVERAEGHGFPCCVCTRGTWLSGDVAAILDLRRWEAPFVDRIVLASIVASAFTVSGEDLVPLIPVPRVGRLDVLKALFAFACQLVVSTLMFPVLRDATRYAMGALKHSVHSCYFCYQRRADALDEEIAFFNRRFGASRTLVDLLALRRRYRPSLVFILRCFPTVVSLHLRTVRDVAALR